ncbi:protein-glutamate methylesterase/protein-glutamine glutaminase [Parvibaculum sedimenti]|nr:chemotaxis response regulator protein-glutamate methylesterase [Parvibaculum sedimenti]
MADKLLRARAALAERRGTATVAGDPWRVMIVDDSSVVRAVIARSLEQDASIKVISSVANGALALKVLPTLQVDVILLDIEMPEMDGIEALPRLLALRPGVRIIMVSSLTRRSAEISLRAMALGAADYIPKPTSGLSTADDFRAELLAKVKAHAARARRGVACTRPPVSPAPRVAGVPTAGPITLRKAVVEKPTVIAIGSSTGGPQALSEVLKSIGSGVTQPIVITQHMPPTFTAILAEHMTRYAGRLAAEAQDGEALQPGRIYVAPGGLHMLAEATAAGTVLRLSGAPPENSCRPAVDPMLRSLSAIYGRKLLAVILTGMGYDGLKGCQVVAASGGGVIAQDQASSVVWGMPGAVAQAGICNAVLPLGEIGKTIGRIARGEGL